MKNYPDMFLQSRVVGYPGTLNRSWRSFVHEGRRRTYPSVDCLQQLYFEGGNIEENSAKFVRAGRKCNRQCLGGV